MDEGGGIYLVVACRMSPFCNQGRLVWSAWFDEKEAWEMPGTWLSLARVVRRIRFEHAIFPDRRRRVGP